MTTTKPATDQPRNVALFSAADSTLGAETGIVQEWEKGPNGNDILILKRVPLFHSGEFSDSMGYERTWEEIHIHQMAANFAALKDTGIFPNVPVRKDHPSFVGNILDNVVGYHRNLYVERLTNKADGQEYMYILGDLEIIDKDAQEKYLNGLWRSRSAEIGVYQTNNKAEFWPTFMGVAFVDIPAVEGLNFENQMRQHISTFSKNNTDIALMMEERMEPATQPPAPGNTADHGKTGPTFEFNIGGRKTCDFAAVQAHIDTLETRNAALENVQKEARDAARESFAKGLVAAGKILATKEADTVELCKGMTDEQFASYRSIMEDAAVAPVLGKYGHESVAPGSQISPPANPQADRVDLLKSQVSMHRQSGKTVEQIKEFGSYKELIALEPTFVLK